MTSRSPSGRRSASIARSSVASSDQASRRSISSCTFAWSASSASKSASGSAKRGRDRVEAVEQVAQLADAVLDVPAHVLGRVELGLLLEQADGRAGRELRLAARGLLAAGHDPQQRRLPGAVRPEHADLRPVEERERDVREHLPVGAVELVGPVHRVDVLRHVMLRALTRASQSDGRPPSTGSSEKTRPQAVENRHEPR